MTNLSGFCRYRFGDVVRIGGFHHEAPMVEFRYRTGQMLNVRGEKTSETMVMESIRNVFSRSSPTMKGDGASSSSSRLVDYACAEYLHRDAAATPHYVVFVELEDGSKLTGTDVKALDLEIQRSNPIYKSFRVKGAIEPARVVQVNSGAFLGLRDTLIAGGGAANQLKIPRVLRRKADVDLLWNEKCS